MRKKEDHANQVRSVYQATVDLDEELREQSDTVDNHYKSLILKPVPGFRRGTKTEVDNFLVHICPP